MGATPTVYVICDQNCKFEGMTKEQILTAIMQAVNNGVIGDIDAGFITTIKTINGVALKFFVGEQAGYDALTAEEKKDLFAIITNDTTKEDFNEAIKKALEAADGNSRAIEKIVDGTTTVKKAESATSASSASTATKATKDSAGNTIKDFYLPKKNAAATLEDTRTAAVAIGQAWPVGSLPEGKTLADLYAVSVKGNRTTLFCMGGEEAETGKQFNCVGYTSAGVGAIEDLKLSVIVETSLVSLVVNEYGVINAKIAAAQVMEVIGGNAPTVTSVMTTGSTIYLNGTTLQLFFK